MNPAILYSQHLDVTDENWRPRACGIVALKTAMDALGVQTPDIDDLIKIGEGMGAYEEGVGWRHQGLIDVAKRFGLHGECYDWAGQLSEEAFAKLRQALTQNGSCLASIAKDFYPANGGHLIVVREIRGKRILYFEPNSFSRRRIRRWKGIARFLAAWRQRIIIIRK